MAAFLRIIREKWTTLPTPTLPLEGQTIMVTGTNTGLGFETAKKLASLRPKKLIITTRSTSKGEQTLKEIREHLAGQSIPSETEIVPLTLDLGTLDGVESFVETLKENVDRLDGAILNAGLTNPEYHCGADGYEETLQVNTISTIYLAILILPLLVSTAKATGAQTRLTFVSSRAAVTIPTASSLARYLSSETQPLKLMSEASQYPPGLAGGQARYAESKLLLEYGMRNLVQSSSLRDEGGKPHCFINSVCPGVAKSDIVRGYKSGAVSLFIHYFFMPLMAKPAEQGAVCYLIAYSKGEESHGKLFGSGEGYIETWNVLTSEPGKELNRKMWSELVQIMRSRNDDAVTEILGSRS